MNKFLATLLSFFPILAVADGSLSFTPPASDYSVVFLSDIFGIVDGVLHGTGSQIMGSIFAVFNAAVLALGGIVIMYTLLVSTMNTAHEGQMLGQKWSSIWIPVRATMGLALLIPKASGYCLMQIFVMWIVVQGVGAADKIWNAALDYLNRGGVIIQAQMNPTTAMTKAATSGIPYGAQIILAGEVCMLSLQNQLQNQLEIYQTAKQTGTGVCSGTPAPAMAAFCNSTVPNFIASVNVVEIQNNNPIGPSYTAPMPNFDATSPYAVLNGICGSIQWNVFPPAQLQTVATNIPAVQASDLETASMSRVIAIQQMYMDLATVAQVMVGNDPALGKQSQNSSSASNFSPMAIAPFGVPQTATGVVCANATTPNCILWGTGSSTSSAPLLNGTEFPGAILDYNGIMMPTLNLIQQAQNAAAAQDSREFIQNATTQGWIMAGSYFFNLINLNVQASQGTSNLTDSNTGLENSAIDPTLLTQSFTNNGGACGAGTYAVLCTWLGNQRNLVAPIASLINGSGTTLQPLPIPTFNGQTIPQTITGAGSSTVYGYTNNSTILQLPGQPGMAPLPFAGAINVNIDVSVYELPAASFSCGSVNFGLITQCIGSLFGDLFYNYIFRVMYNFFLNLFQVFINNTIIGFLLVPLAGMASIFTEGLSIISIPGINPVIALANMGTYYINFAANLWLELIEMSIVATLIPLFGIFMFALLAMTMPILLAWLGIMLQIGFTTAYYVPILPYMIFTFGAISWLMAVIEAMVAAPIVALGVTHPEGHDAFGKGEQAIMILMNIFLRPSMMIIGYIAAISLTYVSVWVINAGFTNAISFIHQGYNVPLAQQVATVGAGTITGGYVNWAGIFAFFFSILVYTMLYLTVVQKAFTLISALPDKVLRWIGGQQESYGADTAQWGQEVQGKVSEAGKDTAAGQAQMDKQMEGKFGKMLGKGKEGASGSKGGSAQAKGGGGGGDATPSAE